MKGARKLAEKPMVKKEEVAKRLAKRMRISENMALDFIDVYSSLLFDIMLENKEIYLEYIGRLWISEPTQKFYGDFKTGERVETVRFPVVKFKPMQAFAQALRGPKYKEIKKQYKASLEAAKRLQEDEEFKKIFVTDVQARRDDYSRFMNEGEESLDGL